MKTLKALLIALATSCLAGPAAASDYPGDTVRIIVPFPPGGSLDVMARPMAEQLRKLWGKPVLIENRPGASTIIGSEIAAKSPPNGLTLLFTADVSITSNPFLFQKLPFDPLVDLVPISQVISSAMIVAVNPSLGVSSLPELVELARREPERIRYASFGTGSPAHLLFEALRARAGASFLHVPYKGYAPALTATIGGETQVTLVSAMSGDYFASGRLKPIAIDREQRLAMFPDLPTLKEAGYENTSLRIWFGLFAPKGTPQAIVDRIQRDVRRVVDDPWFRETQIDKMGFAAVGSTPAEFRDFIASDYRYKGDLIRSTGIRIE